MKKSKEEKKSKREVKVNDLQPEKNPTGGVTPNDIVIIKNYDKSSPVLIK